MNILNLIITKPVSRYSAILLFFACVLLTIYLYLAGLNGGYYFDDAHVIQGNQSIKISELGLFLLARAADSFKAGGREISMLSFALNHYFFGDSTWWYKFVNLMIHCLNGLGLFILSSQLVARLSATSKNFQNNSTLSYLPLVVVALWLIQPINLIPVLYISQRMALLSGFFVIFGLVYYLWARSYFTSTTRKLVYLPLGMAFFGIIGFKCKENAALLPLYVLILEITVLKFKNQGKENGIDRIVVGLFCVGVFVAIFGVILMFLQNPGLISSGYGYRYFSLEERVFTQFRALVFYIFQIVMPSNSQLGLWHDDFGLSTGLFSPATTLFSLIFLVGLLVTSMIAIQKVPLFSLGILWFFVSHAIESTVIPLELIHEHRNYLASFGILLAILSFAVWALRRRRLVLYPLFILLFISHSYILHQRSIIWSNETMHAEHEAYHHPESAAALYKLGKHYHKSTEIGVDGAKLRSYPLMLKAAEFDQHTIISELFLVILSGQGRIEYQSDWLNTAAGKLEKYPYMSPSKSALMGLYSCINEKMCLLPEDDIDRLIEVAYNSSDAHLQTTAAFYYANVKKDNKMAERAFEKALTNKALSWVNYLAILLNLDKKDKACSIYSEFNKKLQNREIINSVQFAGRIANFRNMLKDCQITDRSS